nr:hypothetical protein [uncultured Carboxylicivirga sp.]
MTKNILTSIIITFLTITSCAQKKEKQLIGTWERVKEKPTEPLIQIGQANAEPIEVLLLFNKNGTIKVKQGPETYSAKYKLKANQLTLGNRKYELLKLDSDSLVMKEIINLEFLASTYRYFRTDKHIDE